MRMISSRGMAKFIAWRTSTLSNGAIFAFSSSQIMYEALTESKVTFGSSLRLIYSSGCRNWAMSTAPPWQQRQARGRGRHFAHDHRLHERLLAPVVVARLEHRLLAADQLGQAIGAEAGRLSFCRNLMAQGSSRAASLLALRGVVDRVG